MERLKEIFGDWYEPLKGFILSEEFRILGRTLKDITLEGKIITPNFKEMFRAFKECPYEQMHSLILGQDPYAGVTKDKTLVADGIAFSSRNSSHIPKSLELIYKAIDEDIYQNPNLELSKDFDLKRWANQGILLLNTSLSTLVGKSNQHAEIWEPFIKYVLQVINKEKKYLGCILMGKAAKSFKPLLNNSSFMVSSCEHPAASTYNPGGKWKHESVFKQLDAFQEHTNQIIIRW